MKSDITDVENAQKAFTSLLLYKAEVGDLYRISGTVLRTFAFEQTRFDVLLSLEGDDSFVSRIVYDRLRKTIERLTSEWMKDGDATIELGSPKSVAATIPIRALSPEDQHLLWCLYLLWGESPFCQRKDEVAVKVVDVDGELLLEARMGIYPEGTDIYKHIGPLRRLQFPRGRCRVIVVKDMPRKFTIRIPVREIRSQIRYPSV